MKNNEVNMSIINLSDSHNAKAFATNNLIHNREFKLVKRWIAERIEKAPILNNLIFEEKNQFSNVRLHDTISILGSRGSGKTTFLYSLLYSYRENEEVEVLDIIDPTLIEDKGHVFLTIISQIKKKVDDKLSKNDCNPESTSFQQKRAWESKLRRLAAGIPSLDGVGQGYESWQDPEIIMYKGLSSVAAAKNLEADFVNLVKYALSILKKRVFIISFDDIDINFQRGWPVLETIRKYLTSPHIITLLSGDLRLFSKAIRKQQWENFGKALLINEGELLCNISDYNDLVTEMEGQYLLKVLQSQRRVNLTTLLEKKNINGGTDLEISINDKTLKIEEHYNNILRKFAIQNKYQANAYRSFLLNLPIRTQIQFLSAFESESENNLKSLDFISPFISDLYEKRVEIDMVKSNSTYLIPIILKLLINERVLNDGYQLQPTTLDNSLNSSLISLSFLFSANTIDNPYLIFNYMVRIGYVRNLLSVLRYREKSNSSHGAVLSMNNPSIEGLCEHASIFDDKVLKDVASYMSAYIQADNIRRGNKNSNVSGMIALSALEINRNKKKEDIAWRIDDVLQNASPLVRTISYLPLTISENQSGQNTPIYSVYVLLGAIGELIRKVKNKDLSKGILELSQVRSYPMPSFDGMTMGETADVEILGEYNISEEKNGVNEFNRRFTRWVNSYDSEHILLSPHLLGKISTRFYYSLGNIEKKVAKKSNLGQEMQRRIISLMNAILVEDIKENIDDIQNININLNNPNISPIIFINNLRKINQQKDKDILNKLSFSRWMLSCPLLLSFLSTNDFNRNRMFPDVLFSFIGYSNIEIIDFSVYDKLTEVMFENPNKRISNRNETNDNLSSFYYSKENIEKIIDRLKKHNRYLDFESFMVDDIVTLLPKLRKIFGDVVDDIVDDEWIKRVRTYIMSNNIKSW